MFIVIKLFHEKKNETKYFQKYFENLKFVYEQNHLHKKSMIFESKVIYLNKTYRILFRFNFKNQINV